MTSKALAVKAHFRRAPLDPFEAKRRETTALIQGFVDEQRLNKVLVEALDDELAPAAPFWLGLGGV